jgi:hypothetical protein
MPDFGNSATAKIKILNLQTPDSSMIYFSEAVSRPVTQTPVHVQCYLTDDTG